MDSRSACRMVLSVLLLALVPSLSPAHALPSTQGTNDVDGVTQVLSFVSTCPDPRFTCANPVDIPVPSKPTDCVPYDRSTSDLRGSFTVTWSDSPALPSGTTVAVCTTVHLWTNRQCQGDRFTVQIPELARVLLDAKAKMQDSGELLRLGYSGPWQSEASFESVSCGNVTAWHTEGEPTEYTGFEEIDAELVEEKLSRHRITFRHTMLLVVGTVMVVFSLSGMALACAFRDTLERIASSMEEDDVEGNHHNRHRHPGSSAAVASLLAQVKAAILGTRSVVLGSANGSSATICVDPDKIGFLDVLRMTLLDMVASRWSVLLLRIRDPFVRTTGTGTPENQVPLCPSGEA